ncbi:hypothetical protein EBR96_02640 [bacterium]|nr:hypothetical protein [bacterium]
MRKLLFFLLAIGVVGVWGCSSEPKIDPNRRVYVGYAYIDRVVQVNPKSFSGKHAVKPHVVAWHADFQTSFPIEQVKSFHSANIVPMIVWEPRIWDSEKPVTLESVASGEWDAYIRTWIAAARTIEQPIVLNFAPDFNSDLYPWGVPNNGQNGQSYVDAYRHVVGLFRKEGVTNVIFVWSFLAVSSPIASWNDALSLYPGDEFVDWIGVSSVNQVSDMALMYKNAVDAAYRNHENKPIMIAQYYYEPSEKANKKVIETLVDTLPQVKAVIFSNPKTLKMDPQFFKSPLFQASIEEFPFMHI